MKYKVDNVRNYSKTNGWLCGQFFPDGSVQKNDHLEVKYENLKPGDIYPPHYHPRGTEVCVVIKGKIKWQLEAETFILEDGDFIFMENNVKEAILEVLEPSTTMSIRTPSVPGNKINLT